MDLDGDQVMRLIYLTIWATVLLSYVLVSRAKGIGQALRHLVLWGLIFVGVAAGFGLWQDLQPRSGVMVTGEGAVELRAGRDGHFRLELDVNEVPVAFILDTGATELVLSQQDAARVGLNPQSLPYLGQARTANGLVRIARVTLDEVTLRHGELEFRDTRVPAFVNEGQLDTSLLGMTYLRNFARITIEGDRLRLER
ncbi:MAG: retropepsin-like aspartic protease family protein [Roseinatronobacter sp.]